MLCNYIGNLTVLENSSCLLRRWSYFGNVSSSRREMSIYTLVNVCVDLMVFTRIAGTS